MFGHLGHKFGCTHCNSTVIQKRNKSQRVRNRKAERVNRITKIFIRKQNNRLRIGEERKLWVESEWSRKIANLAWVGRTATEISQHWEIKNSTAI